MSTKEQKPQAPAPLTVTQANPVHLTEKGGDLMARYIEAETAKKFIQQETETLSCLKNNPEHIVTRAYLLAIKHVIEDIDYVPTADVVEVVRCRDCKACDVIYPVKNIGEDAIEAYFCIACQAYRQPTDFCSYGVRRQTSDQRTTESI